MGSVLDKQRTKQIHTGQIRELKIKLEQRMALDECLLIPIILLPLIFSKRHLNESGGY